jgi:cell wall-associated NlpC family hydrolase
MPPNIHVPDIQALVTPLLGASYATMDCWDLVRELFRQGFGLDLARQTEQAATAFQEVWYRGDAVDPLAIVQSWDLVIIANQDALPVSDHIGVVLDAQMFVHARASTTGVAVARLRTWKSRLLQLARYRELL